MPGFNIFKNNLNRFLFLCMYFAIYKSTSTSMFWCIQSPAGSPGLRAGGSDSKLDRWVRAQQFFNNLFVRWSFHAISLKPVWWISLDLATRSQTCSTFLYHTVNIVVSNTHRNSKNKKNIILDKRIRKVLSEWLEMV